MGGVGREAGLSGGQVSKLAGIVSVAALGNTTCPECGGERWATNRTGYHDQIKVEIVGGPCPTCEGRPHWESRGAVYEMSVSNLAAKMPRVDELGLRHAVALAALARVGLSEDLREIRPVLWAEARIAPTPELGKNLLVELHERGTIMIAPEAPLSAFDFGDNPETGEAYVTSWRSLEVDWFAKFADAANRILRAETRLTGRPPTSNTGVKSTGFA